MFSFAERKQGANLLNSYGPGACAAMADRRSTVRINAERLRASLKAGEAEPARSERDDGSIAAYDKESFRRKRCMRNCYIETVMPTVRSVPR